VVNDVEVVEMVVIDVMEIVVAVVVVEVALMMITSGAYHRLDFGHQS